jgi:hypothetical protein
MASVPSPLIISSRRSPPRLHRSSLLEGICSVGTVKTVSIYDQTDGLALGRVRSPSGPELQGRPSENAVAPEMRSLPASRTILDQGQATELRIVANNLKTQR